MARFSERNGIQSPQALQVESVNDELRNSLWNLFLELYDAEKHGYWGTVAFHIARDFRKCPIDDLPTSGHIEIREWVKKYYYHDLIEWYEIYDFLEFIVENHKIMTDKDFGSPFSEIRSHMVDTEGVVSRVNYILERERSGYRFIQGTLSPITNPVEIEEINTAINASQEFGLSGAQEHLRTAIKLLGLKPNPEYRNSIKESISAVESVAKQIAGPESGGLKDALKILTKETKMHGALQAGFNSLYGYTSDEGGIRHSMMDEPNLGLVDANFMLVSCSAFVNYLIVKADDAGLLKSASEGK